MGLSVAIITRDEEASLPRCLASVEELADEVVVVDSGSTDRTRDVARDAGATVVEQAFLGHRDQKQFALERTREEWVLSLDADEWLDDDLAAAVRAVVAGGDDGRVGFAVNRRNRYLGGWIDHCGWSPEWRLRLVRRGHARWGGEDPHDRLEADGPTGRLPGRLLHDPYRSLAHHLGKVNRYTDVIARRRAAAGERPSAFRLVTRPPARFLRIYVLRAGWLDGWRGLVVATMGAVYVFLKHAKLFDPALRAPPDRTGSSPGSPPRSGPPSPP